MATALNERDGFTTASPLLRTPEAATYIGRSVSWLSQQRLKGHGPRYMRIGHSVRYRISDLDEYLASGLVETADTVPRRLA